MTKILLLAAAAASILTASAQVTNQVRVAWDRNPESDVDNYFVRFGVVGTTQTNVLPALNDLELSITNLAWSTRFWFYVTASNRFLESDPSEVLEYTMPPEPVKPSPPPAVNLRLRIISGTNVFGPFTNEIAVLEYRRALPLELFIVQAPEISIATNEGPAVRLLSVPLPPGVNP